MSHDLTIFSEEVELIAAITKMTLLFVFHCKPNIFAIYYRF